MRNEKLLFIGGWHLHHGLNHRTRHMAAYFEERFKYIDVVGFTNFYGGPPSPALTKVSKGFSNLLSSRIQLSISGFSRRITVRDIYAPRAMQMPIKDLWRYLNLCQVLRPPYDLAIFGYPGNAWMAWLLRRSGRVKRLIYDDWDYHPGLETNRLGSKIVENRERLCCRQADAVMTVNVLLARLRKKQGARSVVVIPNGIALSLFAQARQKIPHPPTLVYTGSLCNLWGIDIAIRAMPAILEAISDVRLLIAGYGPAEAELRALSRELGLSERVNFLGSCEYHILPSILAQADIGIVTASPDSTFRYYASPLKLMEYMAAGLPVIVTRLGQTEITMQEANSGILIDQSVNEFVSAGVRLLSDKRLYKKFSRAAVKYSARFDWDNLMGAAYKYVLDIMEDKGITPRHQTSTMV